VQNLSVKEQKVLENTIKRCQERKIIIPSLEYHGRMNQLSLVVDLEMLTILLFLQN